jgi:predicted GNAT superfamily acetyltransferase
MRVVAATPAHHAAILALNEEFVDVLAPLSPERLELLDARATYHRVALEQGELVGFLLAFGSEVPHDSVNFRWFATRYPSFLYVDRVVVASSKQGAGIGALLYRDLFRFACGRGYQRVTCEIDTDPPNPRSERFHDAFGFVEVGVQQVEYVAGDQVCVSLRSASPTAV